MITFAAVVNNPAGSAPELPASSLRLVAQDVGLSRRKQGFESPRERQMYPHLLRRVAAILYDCLLLFGVMFAASLPLVIAIGGEAIMPGNPFYLLYLVAISYCYFSIAWTRSGQTLGMKSWRIRLISEHQAPVGHGRAICRFLSAILSWAACGAGFAWALIDTKHRCWHDLISGTALVKVPKNADDPTMVKNI